MEVIQVSDSCEDVNSCPKVLVKGRTAFVVGYRVTDLEVLAAANLAPGEGILAVPLDVYLAGADGARRVEGVVS
jgi:hypothetical protein